MAVNEMFGGFANVHFLDFISLFMWFFAASGLGRPQWRKSLSLPAF
jgi:hypothetical protein